MNENFGDIPSFHSDPEVSELVRRLARTDFSAESRVRASLRVRLLGSKRERDFRPFITTRLVVSWALAALIALLPLKRAFKQEPRFPRGEHGLPVLPGRLLAKEDARPEPLFETHPAAELFAGRPVDKIVEIAEGKIVAKRDGTAVLWDIHDATYALDTRRTSLDEIFVKRAL